MAEILKSMKKIFLLSGLLFCFGFLMAQPPAGAAKKGDTYGDASALKGKSRISDVSAVQNDQKIEGNFSGIVKEVCPKKGCWIKLELADGKTATVKMKDYGFFVPTALEGKKIVIHGNAELKSTTVAELKHLAEDAKKSREEIDAITEPRETITIMADGIKVRS